MIETRENNRAIVVDRLHDYHDLFDNLPLMYFALDSTGGVVEVNRFGAEQLGYEQTELVGNSVLDVFHPDDRDSVLTQFTALLESPGQVAHWEFRKERKDGSMLWVQESARAIENEAGETLVMVVCEDITSRKETEQRLERYRNRLKQLTIELSLAEEAERRRIATGLHDEIGQKLALAKLRLGQLPLDNEKQQSNLEGIRDLLDDAIEETRSLTFELASPVLYELGLGAATQTLAEHFGRSDGPEFSFAEKGEPRELAERTQLVLYRIVRELMLNVVKHSRAESAGVLVSWLDGQIEIEVRDDGIGFDPAAADDSERTRSYGLFKTRERLDQIGGQLDVHSVAASGTVATVRAPLDIP